MYTLQLGRVVRLTQDNTSSLREDELDIDSSSWSRKKEMKEGIHMMISHHPPSLFGHCLRVTFMGKSLYICARCGGIYGGLFGGLVALFLVGMPLEPSWLWFLFSLAIGFATVFDWITQRLTPRKTTVRVRAITGLLSGISLAIIFYLANLFYMFVALVVMGVTVSGVSLIENRRIKKFKATDLDRDNED